MLDEILEDLRARGTRFFGMELRGKNVVLFKDGHERSAVIAQCNSRIPGVEAPRKSALNKNKRPPGLLRKEHARPYAAKLIPSHVRQPAGGRERRDALRE